MDEKCEAKEMEENNFYLIYSRDTLLSYTSKLQLDQALNMFSVCLLIVPQQLNNLPFDS